MKISLNWLNQFLHLDMSAEDIACILTDIGLEVEKVELVESIKEKSGLPSHRLGDLAKLLIEGSGADFLVVEKLKVKSGKVKTGKW